MWSALSLFETLSQFYVLSAEPRRCTLFLPLSLHLPTLPFVPPCPSVSLTIFSLPLSLDTLSLLKLYYLETLLYSLSLSHSLSLSLFLVLSLPLLQVEALVDEIGNLNLFEVVEFTECLKFKLKIPDMPMGGMMMAGPAGGDDAEEAEVRRPFCSVVFIFMVPSIRIPSSTERPSVLAFWLWLRLWSFNWSSSLTIPLSTYRCFESMCLLSFVVVCWRLFWRLDFLVHLRP